MAADTHQLKTEMTDHDQASDGEKSNESAPSTQIKNKEFIMQQYSGGALTHVHLSTRTQFHDSYKEHLKAYMQKHI